MLFPVQSPKTKQILVSGNYVDKKYQFMQKQSFSQKSKNSIDELELMINISEQISL